MISKMTAFYSNKKINIDFLGSRIKNMHNVTLHKNQTGLIKYILNDLVLNIMPYKNHATIHKVIYLYKDLKVQQDI